MLHVLVSSTFSPDSLEVPMRAWASGVLGLNSKREDIKFSWVPYGQPLSGLQRTSRPDDTESGPSHLRLLIVRLMDLALIHPETGYPILTMKNNFSPREVGTTGQAKVSEEQLGSSVKKLVDGVVVAAASDPSSPIIVILAPPPPQDCIPGSRRHTLHSRLEENIELELSKALSSSNPSLHNVHVEPSSSILGMYALMSSQTVSTAPSSSSSTAASSSTLSSASSPSSSYPSPSLPSSDSSLKASVTSSICESKILQKASTINAWNAYSESGYNENNDRVMHSPYTRSFLLAVAGICWRMCLRASTLASCPRKVLALDCDNTLWDGVLGEDGVGGIRFGRKAPHRLFLHHFALRLQRRGLLLCLISRNEDEDVVNAFKTHQRNKIDWPLHLGDHFVARHVNWNEKYDNLILLSKDLNLNVADVIMVDDSPAECGKVLQRDSEQFDVENGEHSGLCVVQLPSGKLVDHKRIQNFLENHWVFDSPICTSHSGISDRLSTTENISIVDQKRTRLYQEATLRNEARRKSQENSTGASSLGSASSAFLASLNLSIEIVPLIKSTVSRASQLTSRISQMTTRRGLVPQGELNRSLKSSQEGASTDMQRASKACFTVSVGDRFGHHGIVGVMVCRAIVGNVDGIATTCGKDNQLLLVDRFALSCRSMHLGVEHAMIRHLAKEALDLGCTDGIALRWTTSERNRPMYMFLKSIGAEFIAVDAESQTKRSQTTGKSTLSYKLGVGHREALSLPVPDDLRDVSKSKRKREMKKRWLEKMRRETPGFTMRGWRRAKRDAALHAQTMTSDETQTYKRKSAGSPLLSRKIPKLQPKKSPQRHLEKVSQHVYRDSEYGALPEGNGLLLLTLDAAMRAVISLPSSSTSGYGDKNERSSDVAPSASLSGNATSDEVDHGTNDCQSETRLAVECSMSQPILPAPPIYLKSTSACTLRCLHSSVYQHIADVLSNANLCKGFMADLLSFSGKLDKGCISSALLSSNESTEAHISRDSDDDVIDVGSSTLDTNPKTSTQEQYQEQWRKRRKLRNCVKQMIREQNPSSYYKDVVL